VNGITRVTRKGGKQLYRIAFSFMGVQCREPLALPHTKANDTYCERLRAEILGKITRGDFRYDDYFPKSPRAAVFGHGPGRTPTLKDALEAYRDRVKNTLEASTFAAYRKAIDHQLVPWCGTKRIPDLTPADIREWVGLQTVCLKTIRNRLLPLRNVLNEAVADEIIKTSPLDRVDLAGLVPPDKRESDFEPEPYTEAEIHALLANLPPAERYVFQAWAYTGVRTGEQVGLRWPRVDLEAGSIRIEETTTERKDKPRPKTKAGRRTIPLLPAALEAFELQRQFTLLSGDRVFQNARSTRKDKAWDDKKLAGVWKRAHKHTGIAYRNPYQLRHTFASQLLSQGENPAYIAKLLGHKTVEMVIRTYGRWVEQGERLGFDRPPRKYGMARLWTAPETPLVCEK
jgi:integrase